MSYLLDTSALLAHYRQETGWETVQGLFEEHDADIVIASPSLTEFARRLHDLGMDDAEIQEVLADYSLLFTEIVAVDASIALAAYGVIRQTPDRLPLIAALIAAVAQTDDTVLIHRDAHMKAIPAEIVNQHLLI